MARQTSGDTIRVHGLPELQRGLKQVEGMERELSKTNKSVASMVAKQAQGAAYSLGSTPAHVAPSLKATARATYAAVTLGGGQYEMAAGAEFGSDRYPQFKPWRGTGEGGGYFLWPTIRRDEDRIVTEYEHGIDDLLRRADLV